MFALSPCSHRKSRPAKVGSFRPTLERLESRDCPSTISIFYCYGMQNNMVQIAGQVTNTPTPSGLTVQLTGEVNGTATTDSSGDFHATLSAPALGTVYAATGDGQSNTAQATIMDMAAPAINDFGYMEEPNSYFMFVGHVNNGYQGEVVNLGGIKDLQGKTATVDSNGNFQILVQLDGQFDDSGNATAQAVDCWNVASNLASTWVTQTGV